MALYSEVEGPALPGILDHLQEVEFINEVVISMSESILFVERD